MRRSRILACLRNPKYLARKLYIRWATGFLKSERAKALPFSLKLNTGYTCNLRCPLCPTGRGIRPKNMELRLETVQSLLPSMADVPVVELYGFGEPFLNKDIFDIISLLKTAGKVVEIDSNLNIRNSTVVDRIAKSGIDFLSVSLDGADQESYASYRYNGSFETAYKNTLSLRAAIKGWGRMQWQFLVHMKNQDQVGQARDMAGKAKVDFKPLNIGLYIDMFYRGPKEIVDEWLSSEQQLERQSEPHKGAGVCRYMYDEPYVDCDGKVYPCCYAPYAPKASLEDGFQNVFGDLTKQSLRQVWNNEYYRAARRLFLENSGAVPDKKPICLKCKLYLKRFSPDYEKDMPVFDYSK